MNDWIIRKDKDKSSIHTDHIIHWLTKRQTNSLIFQYFRNAVSHHWTLLSSVTEKVILISTFKRLDYHTHAHRGVANRGCRPTLFFDWLIHELGFRVSQNKKKKTTTTKQLPNPSIAPLIGLHVCEPFSFLLPPFFIGRYFAKLLIPARSRPIFACFGRSECLSAAVLRGFGWNVPLPAEILLV